MESAVVSYLLDTDWIVQALDNRTPAISTLHRLAGSRIFVSWLSVAEVYEGAFSSPNPQAHLVSMRHFLSAFRVLDLNDSIVERFAEVRAFLRRRGEKISDFDLLIGAIAVEYELTLLTFNRRHFDRIPDVTLYQPGAD